MLIVFILLMTIEHHGAGLGFVHASYYDDYEADVCDVTSLSGDMSSAYVTAYYRPNSVCNTTSASRDIHIINVRVTSSHTDDVDERRASRRRQTVQLNIVAAQNDTTVYDGRDLVFVIGSTVPIVWHINTQYIAPTVQLHFWVLNNDSRILREDRPNVKIKRFTLPSIDTESIVAWTSRHLGSVTSSTEPLLTSTITHVLPRSGMGCDRVNESELVQPIEGCVARWNEGAHGKDVHIIEVHSPVERSTPVATSNGATPTIELFAHSNRKTMSRRQHFVLVLRAHAPVLWKLRTKGLRGTLDLITDYSVDTNGVDMNLVRVVTERLGSLSSSALVAWTSDKYGLAVSYTNVQTANYLDLTVDGVKQTKKSAKTSEQMDDEVDQTNDLVKKALNAVEFIKSSLQRPRSLVCHSDGFTLSLRKSILKSHNISRDQLSLRDRTCQPRENRTHYYWTSRFSHCATQQRRLKDRTAYQNAILVSLPHSLQDDYSEDEDEPEEGLSEYSGSGQNQGHSQGQAVVADVDTERASYTRMFGIDFSCDYSHRDKHPTDAQNVEYHLKLYSDDGYQQEMGTFPQDLDEHRTVYVEAGITADVTKQVMIQNCSLVPAESWQVRQHPLIVKGCVLDKTVKWMHDDPNGVSQNQRFEFVLQKYWEGERELMLQCELTVCSRTLNSASHIPRCVTKTRFCLETNIQHPSLPRRHVPNMVVSRGPLMLRLTSSRQATGAPGATGSSVGLLEESATKLNSASVSDRCSGSAIHVDGLETTAVICIAFAAFVIGILLAGALWYIHSHTGSPRKVRQCGQHSLDTSGESTPCSNAPIAVHQVHRHV